MWLIRKIRVRRNIASMEMCNGKRREHRRFVLSDNLSFRDCISNHRHTMRWSPVCIGSISRRGFYCLQFVPVDGFDFAYGPGTGDVAIAFKRVSQEFPVMRRFAVTFVLALTALGTAACGQTIEQKAATGAVAGALVAGPVGAAVGGAAGAAVGHAEKPN